MPNVKIALLLMILTTVTGCEGCTSEREKEAIDEATTDVEPTSEEPTDSLKVEDQVVGSGKEATAGKVVSVYYTGRLTSGEQFDSNAGSGKPLEFELGAGRVIQGWEQGLVGMKVGGKRKLIIPPDLAYGERGFGNVIPPKSTLVFDVELVNVQTP